MDLLTAGEIAVAVVVLLALGSVVLLVLRRRWLSRDGGAIECGLRLLSGEPVGTWSLGVARFRGESLEWFRSISYSPRPEITLLRSQTTAGVQRQPTRLEERVLYEDQAIQRLENVVHGPMEVGVRRDALMALQSWLEAAPPGLRYRKPIG